MQNDETAMDCLLNENLLYLSLCDHTSRCYLPEVFYGDELNVVSRN